MFNIGILLLIAVVTFGLLDRGVYGLTLFVLLPIGVGAAAVAMRPVATGAHAAGKGALAVFVSLFLLLLLGLEGLICIAMAAPLGLPLGALGGWLVFRFRTTKRLAALLLLPPASLTWDFQAKHAEYEVRSSIEIAAAPEAVWRRVVSFSDIPEPAEWFFRAGLAYPQRARIEGSGPGAIRYCEFSTGPFVEPIDVWDEPNLLRFQVTENPPPMHEWSPYANLLPKHLHGYMVSRQGQFRLTRLPGNRTRLEGTTWYQHGLWPVFYWRVWSDEIIHRIHLRVLNHIQSLVEREQRAHPRVTEVQPAP